MRASEVIRWFAL